MLQERIPLEDYDVQETRRQARAEGLAEGRTAARAELESQLKIAVRALFGKGSTVSEIADMINVSESSILSMLQESA